MDIAVNGAAGAMGRRIIFLAASEPDCRVVSAIEYEGHPQIGQDAGVVAGTEPLGVAIGDGLAGRPDVLLDFSRPEASLLRARECAERGVAVLIGTTGLSAGQRAELERDVASRVPLIVAANTSVGVNLMFRLVEDVSRTLGADYDVEIIEAHHRRKVDSPSGTAKELARRICQALERDPETVLQYGRQGQAGPRTVQEIGVHAVRGGDIVGEHTVIFAGAGERIELTHRAGSRDIFARGALRAARFLVGKAPGIYAMQDVVA